MPHVIALLGGGRVSGRLSLQSNLNRMSSREPWITLGTPVAWFKREAQEALETNFPVGDAERMMQIRQGTRTYDKDKAVWQESFVSLLMTVKDMDVQKLKRVTSIIKSERPEPDIQS
jgi:hypothetical protein